MKKPFVVFIVLLFCLFSLTAVATPTLEDPTSLSAVKDPNSGDPNICEEEAPALPIAWVKEEETIAVCGDGETQVTLFGDVLTQTIPPISDFDVQYLFYPPSNVVTTTVVLSGGMYTHYGVVHFIPPNDVYSPIKDFTVETASEPVFVIHWNFGNPAYEYFSISSDGYAYDVYVNESVFIAEDYEGRWVVGPVYDDEVFIRLLPVK